MSDAKRATELELKAALSAIALAHTILEPHRGLLERFERERQSFDAFAPLFAPSFWIQTQREPWRDHVALAVDAGRRFLRDFDTAKARLLAFMNDREETRHAGK